MAQKKRARCKERALREQAHYDRAAQELASSVAFVGDYFQGEFFKSQVTTIRVLLAAILLRVSVCSTAIGSFLADKMGIQGASGRNRLTRFLRNPRVETSAFLRAGIRFHAALARPLPVVIDWTDWPVSWRYLVVSVPVGTRGVPIFARGVQLPVVEGTQNRIENEVVAEVLAAAAQCGVDVLFLADRGFRRRSLLKKLEGKRSAFVVRLCGKQTINRKDSSGLLKDSIKRGQVRDFGWAGLGSNKRDPLRVRIVAIWSEEQSEPWLLATNLHAPVSEVVSLYDRRFAGIEHPFRDTKGNRYGLMMEWHRIPNGHKLEVAICLVGLAVLAWTAVGARTKELDPTRAFASTKKGDGCSLMRIGQDRCRNGAIPRLDRKFLKTHLPPISFRFFPVTVSGSAGKPKPWHRSVLKGMRHTTRGLPAGSSVDTKKAGRRRTSPKRRAELAAMLS